MGRARRWNFEDRGPQRAFERKKISCPATQTSPAYPVADTGTRSPLRTGHGGRGNDAIQRQYPLGTAARKRRRSWYLARARSTTFREERHASVAAGLELTTPASLAECSARSDSHARELSTLSHGERCPRIVFVNRNREREASARERPEQRSTASCVGRDRHGGRSTGRRPRGQPVLRIESGIDGKCGPSPSLGTTSKAAGPRHACRLLDSG
jgi:hypothetical protein